MAESVKKLLDMGDLHSVVGCVKSRITAKHTHIVSKDIERKLREKVKRRLIYMSAIFTHFFCPGILCSNDV